MYVNVEFQDYGGLVNSVAYHKEIHVFQLLKTGNFGECFSRSRHCGTKQETNTGEIKQVIVLI